MKMFSCSNDSCLWPLRSWTSEHHWNDVQCCLRTRTDVKSDWIMSPPPPHLPLHSTSSADEQLSWPEMINWQKTNMQAGQMRVRVSVCVCVIQYNTYSMTSTASSWINLMKKPSMILVFHFNKPNTVCKRTFTCMLVSMCGIMCVGSDL